MEKEMPEGIEWPRFETGGPVGIGDPFSDRAGNGRTVMYIKFYGGNFSICADDGTMHYYDYGEPVGPAPVIAADGEPLEVGQTVYHIDTGREYQIHSINDDGKGAFVYNNSLGQDAAGLHLCPVGNLTHQRPVLDADGVPVELGDDLYSVEGGLKLHVSNIDRVNCRIATSAMFALDKWADPSMFTHTKPEIDSWERIEADCSKADIEYCDEHGLLDPSCNADEGESAERHCIDCGCTCGEKMARDLVRRCREVAERERGE